MIQPPPRSTRTATLSPYTALFRALTLNEAMSLAKPVVATSSVGGAFDLIENGNNGYLVDQGSLTGLSRALSQLIENKPNRLAAGQMSEEIRSEEHTSELQSLMRISYAVFSLKKKINTKKKIY